MAEKKKAGMFRVVTRNIGDGKVRPDELPSLLAETLANAEHVTPQLITNVIRQFRYLNDVKDFVTKMYEWTLKELVNPHELNRFEELGKMCVTCGLFLDENIETVMAKIKEAAGKPYKPQRKTLDDVAALASGNQCALADVWK